MYSEGWARVVAGCLAIAVALPAQAPAPFDRRGLETVEDLSEDLANDLLELSVAMRRRDLDKIALYFAPGVKTTPVPVRALARTSYIEWAALHAWDQDTAQRLEPRDALIARWAAFLNHFSELEDVRFKLRQSSFPSPSVGQAGIKFFLIGRGCDGQREWVNAAMQAVARKTGSKEKWRIEELTLGKFESTVAATDLFDEVGAPAGVAVKIPPYGSPGNDGFIWSGAAAGDADSDGLIDVFSTGSDRNHLYRNLGNGKFSDIAEDVGLAFVSHRATGALWLDYDNDGDLDLFLSAVGTQMLFQNRLKEDGKLSFREVSEQSGVAIPAVGFSVASADVNGDGLPDIYVASYNRYGVVMPNAWDKATNGTPNRLFVSQGKGRYREMAREYGVDDSRWSYAAEFADFLGDGRQHLFVANDYGEKGLFLNTGGRFTDVARERGVLDPGNGMGVSLGDFDNDGLLDLHFTNMSSTAGNRILQRLFGKETSGNARVLRKLASGNSLYRNMGDGTFKDVTSELGPFSAGWAWGGGFIDFDNDGWEDLYTTNGFLSGKSMKDT